MGHPVDIRENDESILYSIQPQITQITQITPSAVRASRA